MKCPRCHSEIAEQAKLCPECGLNLKERQEKSKPVEAGPTPAPDRKVRRDEALPDTTTNHGKKKRGVPIALPLLVIGLAIIAAALIYPRFHVGANREPQSVSPYYISYDESRFFDELDGAIDFTVKGKYYFLAGQAYEHGKPAPIPLASPPASETQGSNDPAFKAAENYALALEHFTEAKKKIERVSSAPLRPNFMVCRQNFIDVTDKYMDAARIFNNRAKGVLQKDQDVEDTFPLSDAIAKMDLGEKMMADFLTQGCDGSYFRYLRNQRPDVAAKIFGNYRDFFSTNFETIRPALEMLLKNTPTTTPIPVSVLTL